MHSILVAISNGMTSKMVTKTTQVESSLPSCSVSSLVVSNSELLVLISDQYLKVKLLASLRTMLSTIFQVLFQMSLTPKWLIEVLFKVILNSKMSVSSIHQGKSLQFSTISHVYSSLVRQLLSLDHQVQGSQQSSSFSRDSMMLLVEKS